MKKKTLIALALAVAGFVTALLIPVVDLPLAGQITLGIFLFAAVFWVMEPIPIYATSLLVILLQVLLLSEQGPLARYTPPETIQPHATSAAVWEIPRSALARTGEVRVERDGRFHPVDVEIIAEEGDTVTLRSEDLSEESRLARRADHWQAEFAPPPHTVFLNTLASPIIILFLGGFVMAAGASKYKVDRNLIRIILKPFGTRPASVMIGMMVITALLSAFMSNTATTAMMMAVVLPIISAAPEGDRFRIGVALCIPFAANLGGIATPIGTPPNAIALGALSQQGVSIPFTTWMGLTVPLVLVMLLIVWILLLRVFPSGEKNLALELKGSFETSPKAWALYVIAGGTVLLWVTEALHGLSSSLVALIPVALLTAFQVVEKKEVRNLPWEVLWLMAGGLALGVAMRETGLAEWMIGLVPWGMLGAAGALAVFGVVAILLSNFISNTVAATLLMPLVMSFVASGMAEGFALTTAALTVAVGTSLAMALPVSTPPNAIAVSTGLIRTPDMVRMGVLIGTIGYAAVLAMAFLFWNQIF